MYPKALLSDSALSSSVESPDMEVKRYMNDSCSSCSLDSMDHNHDLNVSMSSTDSFDLLLRDVPPIETGPLQKTNLASTTTIKNSGTSRMHDSLSSFEVSASSQESLDDVSADISPKVSSNEGTLTNSPCDKDVSSSSPIKDKRIRKTSWIPNPMLMNNKTDTTNNPTGGSAYPATLDKLFSLFQNPSAIFQRSSPDTVRKDDSSPSSRKESPMGGLLAWATGNGSNTITTIKRDGDGISLEPISPFIKTNILQPNQSPENTVTGQQQHSVPAEIISKELKKEVKENISPENTITTSSVTSKKIQTSSTTTEPVQSVLETPNKNVIFSLGDDDFDEEELFSLSEDLEPSTILRTRVTNTSNSVALKDDTNKSTQLALQVAVSTPTIMTVATNNPSTPTTTVITNATTNTTKTDTGNNNSSSSHAVGLGNIARDSLSIIKGGVNTSQDSMQSLESLPEFEINVPVTVNETLVFGPLLVTDTETASLVISEQSN